MNEIWVSSSTVQSENALVVYFNEMYLIVNVLNYDKIKIKKFSNLI